MRKFLIKEVGVDSIDIELESDDFQSAADRLGRLFEFDVLSVGKVVDETPGRRKFIVSDVETEDWNIVY